MKLKTIKRKSSLGSSAATTATPSAVTVYDSKSSEKDGDRTVGLFEVLMDNKIFIIAAIAVGYFMFTTPSAPSESAE